MTDVKAEEKEDKKEPQETLVESKHTITLAGQEYAYTVTTGTILLREEAERDKESEGAKPKAAMFFTAYTLDGGENRPLTFAFNGGPGSSSVWLHMGALGPRRIEMEFDGARLSNWWITNSACWRKAIWFSLTQSALVSAARLKAKKHVIFTVSRKISKASANLSACTPRATSAGFRQNF